jgi:prevent-host-death family protein
MKVIPLSKAKAQLSRFGRLCHKEPVIVTVNGTPAFQLVPIGTDDDLVEQLLEHHPQFRRLLESRLAEDTIPATEALRRL